MKYMRIMCSVASCELRRKGAGHNADFLCVMMTVLFCLALVLYIEHAHGAMWKENMYSQSANGVMRLDGVHMCSENQTWWWCC